MKMATNLTTAFLIILGGSCLFGDPPLEKAITKADEVIAIYRENWGLSQPSPGPFLILAVWGNGSAVWSDDRLNGGQPYHTATIDPKRLESLLSTFDKRGAFDAKNYGSAPIIPDSQQIKIFMKHNKKQISIASCHELFECGGQAVVRTRETTGLDGMALYDALRTQPSEYLFFRMIWNEIRARSAELVPSADKSVKGKLRMYKGDLSWIEDNSGRVNDNYQRGKKTNPATRD